MLLKRLGIKNRKNKLYRAFRELGRVKRTLFLLRYVSKPDLRRTIRAETTKIESYNDFLDWISFGQAKESSRIVREHDPEAAGIDLSLLAHISPVGWYNVILYGEYKLNRELIRR